MTGDRQYYHIHGCKALPGSVPLIELPPSSAESCRLLELRSAKQKSILSQIRHFDHGTNSNSFAITRLPARLRALHAGTRQQGCNIAHLHDHWSTPERLFIQIAAARDLALTHLTLGR